MGVWVRENVLSGFQENNGMGELRLDEWETERGRGWKRGDDVRYD